MHTSELTNKLCVELNCHGDDVSELDVTAADVDAVGVEHHRSGWFDRLIQTCVVVLVTGLEYSNYTKCHKKDRFSRNFAIFYRSYK
jgi:hypothetical protein